MEKAYVIPKIYFFLLETLQSYHDTAKKCNSFYFHKAINLFVEGFIIHFFHHLYFPQKKIFLAKKLTSHFICWNFSTWTTKTIPSPYIVGNRIVSVEAPFGKQILEQVQRAVKWEINTVVLIQEKLLPFKYRCQNVS